MKIFIESGSGFQSGADLYGREITGSSSTALAAQYLVDYLKNQNEIRSLGIQVETTDNAGTLLSSMTVDDLLFSLHLNFYAVKEGEGLRGFYRSTQKQNSEKCKALAITVTKALSDHMDMYYYGVYNEQRDKHPQLNAVVNAPCLAALIEIGLHDSLKDRSAADGLHKNVAVGIGLGIIRHLSALRSLVK